MASVVLYCDLWFLTLHFSKFLHAFFPRSIEIQKRIVVILMKTGMGHGVDFMMGSHEWHGIPPNDEQLQNALSQLSCGQTDY